MSDNGDGVKTIARIDKDQNGRLKVVFASNVSFHDLSLGIRLASLELGLDIKDLVFLRWMVDFYNTGRMEIHHCEGKAYFWISYQYIIQELPILGIESKDVLARRLRASKHKSGRSASCRQFG